MKPIVVDASIAAALLIPDEWTARVPEVAQELIDSPLHAPLHWPIELASVMVTAERRKRVTAGERRLYLVKAAEFEMLLDIPLIDPSTVISDLAIATGLSAYDAAYLELTERLGARLATNDASLAKIAVKRGSAVITTRS